MILLKKKKYLYKCLNKRKIEIGVAIIMLEKLSYVVKSIICHLERKKTEIKASLCFYYVIFFYYK